jgi:hypothetical protein
MMNIKQLLFTLVFTFLATSALADATYQPFVLASINDTGLAEQTEATVAALEQAGFTITGRYSPVEDADVIVVTNQKLIAISAETDRGGYGAGQRISIAVRDGKTEVAFINPVYIQYAYRLGGDTQVVYDQLVEALGFEGFFGAEKKLTAKKLSKYHYMIGMQRFDDPSELGTFDNYSEALAAVEAGLAIDGDALSQVYRIDIPGKEQTVFGVAMTATNDSEEEMDIDSTFQMSIVDFEGHSKAAYFPYEILVNGNSVEALHMRFRMAVHFPDLSMMGEHGFTKLMSSPKATEKALETMVNGE